MLRWVFLAIFFTSFFGGCTALIYWGYQKIRFRMLWQEENKNLKGFMARNQSWNSAFYKATLSSRLASCRRRIIWSCAIGISSIILVFIQFLIGEYMGILPLR